MFPTHKELKLLMATCLYIGVLAFLKLHTYQFGGKTYLQVNGVAYWRKGDSMYCEGENGNLDYKSKKHSETKCSKNFPDDIIC